MNNKQKNRYTAFIDILGFQKSILNIENEPESYEKIVIALTNVSELDQLRKNVRPKQSDPNAVQHLENYQDLRVQVFSDCILISANENELGLTAVTAMSAVAFAMLFSCGFFARGAITKDQLSHDEKIVFGKALVRAYSLEQKVAIFPRIILSSEVVEDIENKNPSIPFKIDFDGESFLDVFNSMIGDIIESWNKIQTNIQYHINLNNGRNKLVNEIKSEKDPSIQQKLNWLKNYFNDSATLLTLKEIE